MILGHAHCSTCEGESGRAGVRPPDRASPIDRTRTSWIIGSAMNGTVLAALDNSLASRPVLQESLLLGRVLSAQVRAVHVRTNSMRTCTELAHAVHISLETLSGEPAAAICEALEAPGVVLGVLGVQGGVRTTMPAGHTVLSVMSRTRTPLVLVPPGACIPRPGHRLRIALPLGTDEETHPELATLLAATQVNDGPVILPVHVLAPNHAPRFWDQPHHEAAAWSHEFLARHWPTEEHLALLGGSPAAEILRFAQAAEADLVVLDWGQDLGPGHARIVRSVLASQQLPVLLVPRYADAPVPDASPSRPRGSP
jgi:nucleotide-binding universal stress UspA family protein